MQASKSSEHAGYDTFTCQRCDLVMTLPAPQSKALNPGRE